MKIYEKTPIKTTRVTLTKKGEESFSISFIETTKEEVRDSIRSIIINDGKNNPIYEGRPQGTSVQIRDYKGTEYSEGSINFRVLNAIPSELFNLITNEFMEINKDAKMNRPAGE